MRYDKSGGESNEPSPESRTPQTDGLACQAPLFRLTGHQTRPLQN